MPEKVLISAEDLHLSIGRQVLFNGVSLAVNAGERIALIGRNGSGKSTLLKVLCGRELPSSGTVAAAKGLRMAMLPQEFELDESISAAALSGNFGGRALPDRSDDRMTAPPSGRGRRAPAAIPRKSPEAPGRSALFQVPPRSAPRRCGMSDPAAGPAAA